LAIPWHYISVMTGLDSKTRRPRKGPQTARANGKLPQAGDSLPAGLEPAPQGLSFAKALRDCLAFGTILVDSRKQVISLSGPARQLLGLSQSQSALPAFDRLPAPLRAVARETLASGKAPADRQVELTQAGRGPVTLHLSAVPLQTGRKGSGVLLVLSDLTAARQLEERIRQLDRLATLGTLAAGMAHEIKNALVAGKTFVDLLLERQQGAELAGVVRRELGRIDALVSRMLNFAGPPRTTFSPVRLHEILEHSLRLVQPQLQAKAISLTRAFQAAPDLLSGDDYQLQQAFVNLFLNALEAMGPDGTLSVTTEIIAPGTALAGADGAAPAPAQLRLTIKDDGAGIPPEHMGRLFEPFFTTKASGTGLGLPITRRIIEEHRGTITVQSQPDHGTAFQILLPAAG